MLRPVMSVCYYVTRHRGADQQGSRLVQGRTQEGADGAKAPPPKFKKMIIYSLKYGAFYVLQVCNADSMLSIIT